MSKKLDIKGILPFIASLKLKGKKDKECAKILGISYGTFLRYKREDEDFRLAAEADEKSLDLRVEQALLSLATGFSKKIRKVYKLKSSHYDENGKKVEEERLEEREEEVFYPPNLSAQTFWLKGRNPCKWGDKAEKETPEQPSSVGGVIIMPEISLKGGEKNE